MIEAQAGLYRSERFSLVHAVFRLAGGVISRRHFHQLTAHDTFNRILVGDDEIAHDISVPHFGSSGYRSHGQPVVHGVFTVSPFVFSDDDRFAFQ